MITIKFIQPDKGLQYWHFKYLININSRILKIYLYNVDSLDMTGYSQTDFLFYSTYNRYMIQRDFKYCSVEYITTDTNFKNNLSNIIRDSQNLINKHICNIINYSNEVIDDHKKIIDNCNYIKNYDRKRKLKQLL